MVELLYRAATPAREQGERMLVQIVNSLHPAHPLLAPNGSDQAIVAGQLEVTVSWEAFELQHRCTTSGYFGVASDWGDTEVYAVIQLWRLRNDE